MKDTYLGTICLQVEMVIDIGNESKSQRVCVSVCICFPKIVNLNKTLSDFPTILYLYTLFFIHEY